MTGDVEELLIAQDAPRDPRATSDLIVAHEVTNVGTDKTHLAKMANQAKAALEAENLEAFADRGYFKGEEIAS